MTQSSVQIPELPLRSEYGYLSDSNLRLGGRLKVRPEDFIVEEIPAYEPCGDGEHLFLWIEKRDLSAESLTTFVAKKLGIGRDAIGMAGLKDRRAITRQYLSVPARCADKVPTVESDSVKVLRSKRHRNKLHTGHLKGNRFEILLRDATALNSVSPCVSEGAQPVDSDNVADRSAIRSMAKEDSLVRGVLIAERSATLPVEADSQTQTPSSIRDLSTNSPLAIATKIATILLDLGFPNYYGEQRFGHDSETLQLGLDLLSCRRSISEIPFLRRKFLLRLALSAVQSALFNEVLAERLASGLLHRVLPGDVMQVIASGGCFIPEDLASEQLRLERHEIVPTGPMFGPKMKMPQAETALREASVLDRCEIPRDAFLTYKALTPGARRPLLCWTNDLTVTAEESSLRFKFSLPPGVYATTLLREFRKEETTEPATNEEQE